MSNSLEDWIEHGDTGLRTIEDEAVDAGLLASARVILGNHSLTPSQVLGYLRHHAAIDRQRGVDPGERALMLWKWEQESRRPMNAAEWNVHKDKLA